jgi:hypothetical protein
LGLLASREMAMAGGEVHQQVHVAGLGVELG